MPINVAIHNSRQAILWQYPVSYSILSVNKYAITLPASHHHYMTEYRTGYVVKPTAIAGTPAPMKYE